MCVVSMITDHYRERWEPYVWPIAIQPVPTISPVEVAEFKRLLERAREYDKRHNEPHCELEEKKQAIKAIAEKLGVDVSFVDDANA